MLLGLVNAFIAVVAALMLGGSATTGKIEDGRYFLGDRGDYTEVSRPVWMYSKIHMTALEIGSPILLLGLATIAYLEKPRPAS